MNLIFIFSSIKNSQLSVSKLKICILEYGRVELEGKQKR